MRIRIVNGNNRTIIETDDIAEVKIAEMRSKEPRYNIWAFMKNGDKIHLGTEYTPANAVNLANYFKPYSFTLSEEAIQYYIGKK